MGCWVICPCIDLCGKAHASFQLLGGTFEFHVGCSLGRFDTSEKSLDSSCFISGARGVSFGFNLGALGAPWVALGVVRVLGAKSILILFNPVWVIFLTSFGCKNTFEKHMQAFVFLITFLIIACSFLVFLVFSGGGSRVTTNIRKRARHIHESIDIEGRGVHT